MIEKKNPPQLRGYRMLKKSLQRKILEIERERRNAHASPKDSIGNLVVSNFTFDANSFPRPADRPYDHTVVAFRPFYDSVRPRYKRRILIGNTEPR